MQINYYYMHLADEDCFAPITLKIYLLAVTAKSKQDTSEIS